MRMAAFKGLFAPVIGACLLAAGGASGWAQDGDEDLFADRWRVAETARLEALDKVTGRVSVIELPLESPTQFGTLEIIVRACHRRPPNWRTSPCFVSSR